MAHIARTLSPEELDWYIAIDRIYTGENATNFSMHNPNAWTNPGGVSHIIDVIKHCEFEIKFGMLSKVGAAFKDLDSFSSDNWRSYFDYIGTPGQKIIDDLLDQFRDTSLHYATFLAWQTDRINSQIGRIRTAAAASPIRRTFPAIEGLKWEDVTIVFLTKVQIEVRARSVSRKFGISEIEFADGRQNELQGNGAWLLLFRFARDEGELRLDGPASGAFRKRIMNLKKTIRAIFDQPPAGNPIGKHLGTYTPRFQLLNEIPSEAQKAKQMAEPI